MEYREGQGCPCRDIRAFFRPDRQLLAWLTGWLPSGFSWDAYERRTSPDPQTCSAVAALLLTGPRWLVLGDLVRWCTECGLADPEEAALQHPAGRNFTTAAAEMLPPHQGVYA